MIDGAIQEAEKGRVGRPPGNQFEQHLRSLRRELMAMTGGARWYVNVLMEAVRDAPDWKDKLTALKLMMEYGYGKPVQNVQLDAQTEATVQIVVNTGVLQPERPSAIPATPARIIEHEPNPLTMNELLTPPKGEDLAKGTNSQAS